MDLQVNGYQNEGRLGQGGMGTVWKCRHKATNKLYAVKEMSMNDHVELRKELIDRVHNLLEAHKSPFLVEYLSFCTGERGEPCFVFEYLPGGDLCHLLQTQDVSRAEAVRWVREITSALCYLHSKGLIHRDVKAGNVMLTNTDSMLASAKLSDFDTLRDVKDDMTQGIGTGSHRAPETIRGSYNEKADIWSLGCLTHTLLMRKTLPFPMNPSDQDLIEGPKCQGLDSTAADFIKRCLAYNYADRPSASELLQHPFLAADESLVTYLQSFVDNSLLHARYLSTSSLSDGYSAASNAYRMALETLDIYRDRQVAGVQELQAKVEELEVLTAQLARHMD